MKVSLRQLNSMNETLQLGDKFSTRQILEKNAADSNNIFLSIWNITGSYERQPRVCLGSVLEEVQIGAAILHKGMVGLVGFAVHKIQKPSSWSFSNSTD